MTNEMRRYMHARNRVKSTMLDPLADMLEAHATLVASLRLNTAAVRERAFRDGYAAGESAGQAPAPFNVDIAWEAYID